MTHQVGHPPQPDRIMVHHAGANAKYGGECGSKWPEMECGGDNLTTTTTEWPRYPMPLMAMMMPVTCGIEPALACRSRGKYGQERLANSVARVDPQKSHSRCNFKIINGD